MLFYAAVRIVLLGKSISENSGVGNFLLGRAAFDSEAPPDVVERVGGRLKDRQVMVINSPQLLQTNISDHQITQTVRECVSLSHPGPHVIVLLLKHDQCSAEDHKCVEKVLKSFSERVYQHTLVLTTQEPTETNDILHKIIRKCFYRNLSLQRSSSLDDLLQMFEDIVQKNDEQHLDCAEDEASQYFTMEQQDTERLSEGVKLNLVVCGSDGTLKSSISELILQQTERDMKLHGCLISLVELPALSRLSVEEVMRQTLRCVSLCHPGVHVFLLIIPDAPLNNEDKAEMEEIQRIFSSRINKHMMILIMQNSKHQTEELCEETQSVIESFEGRHHFFGPNTQVSTLMENIEQMVEENRGEFFSTETFLEAQMKKLLQFEEMKKKIDLLETNLLSQERIQHLLQRLHLDRHHNKLRAADVLQITKHSLQSHESCAEEELIQTFIQKLLMMNYRARCIHAKENNDSFEDESDIFKDLSLSNTGTSQSVQIHPMDVQMALFHCADGFLKQLMVTKLSQCQYALPLLVPDPFTQQIEFPLWTFRQINKSWKMRITNNQITSQTQPIYKAETPMVFFFRFGSVSSSKSQLMNSLINEKHNTFFHRNCPGSSRTRVLMDGVVEIAWFCPSGKNMDKFTDCVAFCNLHGDAGYHEKQLQILTEMASVNVVILPKLQRNDKSMTEVEKLYKDSKPLICLFTEDVSTLPEMQKGKYNIGLKDRNQSDVSKELRRAINDCLSEPSSTFRLEDMTKHSDIRVDEEDDDDCRRGREAAQQMMSLLKKKDLIKNKESILPCQGKLWHQWSKKNKELLKLRGEEQENEKETNKKKTEMNKIREQQNKSDVSEIVKFFITEIDSGDEHEMMFFLKWLTILLDEQTSGGLKYNEKWASAVKLKEKPDKYGQLRPKQNKHVKTSEDLQAAVFGLEHIMREIGQIYESCSSVKKQKKGLHFDFSSLPSIAAEMMISGFPLELMDGEADHVPVIWISAVLDELIQKLGDQRVFVLSVLGVQSSGKSTMLNAMFGLQFAVSAGRCTKGAFMQLVRVSEEMKPQMNCDCILVVDTEGLQLAGRSTRHHDNELATFVVGLGNLTLINIFGENPTELQEILQIVFQAFLRMKKVRLNPTCVFVHQNFSDVTAREKNMEGRRRLKEKLDEMTKLVAKDEVYDAECFSDVTGFDVQYDVKYFAQLWEGSPPMAPPNPNYCNNLQELKETIITHASKSHRMMLTDLKDYIKNFWEDILKELFAPS
ncbi:Interferon-induced very large GTPase 1 [Anabarilius grahami]|uniref:Interferon-induced very large GTPase 1 n=1 Tax=Anabarilius grahami TaxID=495550 RepID=A0A3N0XPW1_ANAGA|nr:Interferon-induced very large GTPase 1 [Anabarilius grahami]